MVDISKIFTFLERGVKMAILNRDDYFKKLHERMPNATSDEDISFLEDMTDTYNDLENRAIGESEDWKRRFEENDKAWREKYKHRFFNGGDRNIPPVVRKPDEDSGPSAETITVEDLFE